MKISLTTVAEEDRGKIKRALKESFTHAPAVVITKTLSARTAMIIPVTVTNGPTGKSEMETVSATIDAVLTRHGYRFCNVSHSSAKGSTMANILMIGHGAARKRLAAIKAELLKVPGTSVTLLCDGELDGLNKTHELPLADFLFIGLSREGRHSANEAHNVEQDIVSRATNLEPPIPCCIICDEDGYLAAPYVTTLGSKVELIVVHKDDPGYGDFCGDALIVPIADVIAGAGQIAHTTFQMLRGKQPVSPRALTMAGAK